MTLTYSLSLTGKVARFWMCWDLRAAAARLSPSSGEDGALQGFILLLHKREGESIEMTLASPHVLREFRSAWKAAQSAEMSHSHRKANPRKAALPRTADACEKRPVSILRLPNWILWRPLCRGVPLPERRRLRPHQRSVFVQDGLHRAELRAQ